jgi:hypothetical protein
MNVRARVVSITGVLAAVAALSGVITPPVGASVQRSIAAAPTAVSGTSTRSVAYLVLDDRQLARRTDGWTSSVSSSASLGTLTCSSLKGQTLRVRRAVEAGGYVRVQTGPGRGSIAVRVAGTVVARGSTASSPPGFRKIAFNGAGKVDIRISSAGKQVCIDSIGVVLPDVIPGG